MTFSVYFLLFYVYKYWINVSDKYMESCHSAEPKI